MTTDSNEKVLGTVDGVAGPPLNRGVAWLGERLRSAGILIPFVILFVVISVASSTFFTKDNLLDILSQQSSYLMIAAAGTLVLVSGGIDLSVGATYTFGGVIMGEVGVGHAVWLAVVLAMLTGLVVGLVNGVITTVCRINALIATLAMSFIVTGVSDRIINGNQPTLFGSAGSALPGFEGVAQTTWAGVQTSIWIALAALIVLGVLLSRSTLGRHIFAAGGNAEAARLAGVRVYGVRIVAFAASGVFAALGGVVDTSRTLSVPLSSSSSIFTFTVIAGIIVGGTSILGGEGAIWRTVVGVLFIALVRNGFDQLGANQLYEQITLGVLMLAAVGLDALSRGVLRR